MQTFDLLKNVYRNKSAFLIAEIGKNFIQSKEEKTAKEYLFNAKKLIKSAKDSGADAVKFQTHVAEDEQLNTKVISPHFSGSERYSWVCRNENITSLEFWQEIKRYCGELDIIFFSTPMSRLAAQKLEQIDPHLWKIGSGDILDFVMLDYVAATGKPIIISTGMSNLAEIDRTINFLQKRTNKIVIMHCVSIYPCPPEHLNLGTIKFFQERYGLSVGFSSHSVEWESSVAAVNLGAVAIEKHFSLDRNLWGSDHKVSLMPHEFKAMAESIRRRDKVGGGYYGEESKILHEEENVFRPLFRKSLTAGKDIEAGTVLSKEMLYAMRPQAYAGGIPSEAYEEVLGKKTKKSLKKYDSFTWDILE